jgi:hypothetical protein
VAIKLILQTKVLIGRIRSVLHYRKKYIDIRGFSVKIAKVEIKIAKYIKVDEVKPGKDKLYEDIKAGGRKIVSVAKKLDKENVERIKDYDIKELWVRRVFYRWVSSREARHSNWTLIRTKNVEVPVGKAILKLSRIDTLSSLRSFLKRYVASGPSPLYMPKLKRIERELSGLQPRLQEFRKKLVEAKDSKKGKRVLKLLKKKPDKIGPVDFPTGFKMFGQNYLEYLCELQDLHFQLAEIVIKAGAGPAKKMIET